MNKVVAKDMHASDLSDMIRSGIDPAHRVEVVVRDLGVSHGRPASGGPFARFVGRGQSQFGDTDEILRHIRDVRHGEDPLEEKP